MWKSASAAGPLPNIMTRFLPSDLSGSFEARDIVAWKASAERAATERSRISKPLSTPPRMVLSRLDWLSAESSESGS